MKPRDLIVTVDEIEKILTEIAGPGVKIKRVDQVPGYLTFIRVTGDRGNITVKFFNRSAANYRYEDVRGLAGVIKSMVNTR